MKVLSASRNYLRWLIWPGLALATAGLVVGILNSWNVLAIVLLVVGLLLTLMSFILGGFGYRSFWQSRSTQAGTNAVVATISILLILGVVNFLAVQYAPQFDLTEAGLFTLAPETRSVVQNLQQPVKVVVFDASLYPNDQQLLDSYRKFNPELTYEHINPFQDPVTAREFNVSGEGREVHLVAGEQKIFVQPLGGQGINEQDLTNKLAQLGRDRDAVVYFLQGHNEFVIDGSESGYAQAAETLRDENFAIETLNLAETAAVPSDADAVVVAGPKQAFFKPEVAALEAYLNDGGSLFLLIDPQTEPELAPLLDDWGIALDDRLIIDASNTGQIVGLGPAAPLVTNYGSHPITDAFNNGRSFYPLARPILVEAVEGVEVTPLLLSNAQSYAEPLTETGELQVDTQNSPEGPFNIGVALTKTLASSEQTADAPEQVDAQDKTAEPSPEEASKNNDSQPNDASNQARLVIIGNATFATDGLFGQQLNGDVFLNSVSWLSNIDNAILSIRPKEITNRRIVMTVSQQIVVILLALVVFPLLGLIGAGVTWFRRR